MLLALRAFCKKQLLKNKFFFSGPKHFMDSRFMDVLCSPFFVLCSLLFFLPGALHQASTVLHLLLDFAVLSEKRAQVRYAQKWKHKLVC